MVVDFKNLSDVGRGNQPIILADGTFDLFHLGHVRAFENLRKMDGTVVIAVLSDDWVKSKKGDKRPVLNQFERLELVDSIRYVDFSILAVNSETGERIRVSEIIKSLKPDIFVTVDANWKDLLDFQSLGVELRIVERVHESSTSNLLQRIKLALFE